MSKFKVGDLVRGIQFYGAFKLTASNVNDSEYPLWVETEQGYFIFTEEGFIYPDNAYPSIWHAESGHGPEVGERPVWKPKVPTWCEVWDEENQGIKRLVIAWDGLYRIMPVDGQHTTNVFKHAEPCEPPSYWPKEWTV